MSRRQKVMRAARNRRAGWIIGATCAVTLIMAVGLVGFVHEPWYSLIIFVPGLMMITMRPAAMKLARREDVGENWFFRWLPFSLAVAAVAFSIATVSAYCS